VAPAPGGRPHFFFVRNLAICRKPNITHGN
jgi:hypothetical protein